MLVFFTHYIKLKILDFPLTMSAYFRLRGSNKPVLIILASVMDHNHIWSCTVWLLGPFYLILQCASVGVNRSPAREQPERAMLNHLGTLECWVKSYNRLSVSCKCDWGCVPEVGYKFDLTSYESGKVECTRGCVFYGIGIVAIKSKLR